MSSVRENSVCVGESRLPELRSLDQILTFDEDDSRFPKMRETWRAFAGEMAEQVLSTVNGGRTPAEIAYGVGVILHNYFRTRGIPLTTYELRALAGELVELPKAASESVERTAVDQTSVEPMIADAPTADEAIAEGIGPSNGPLVEIPEQEAAADLVSFIGATTSTGPWVTEDTESPPQAAPARELPTPASPLVNVVARDAASFDRLLHAVVELAGARLGVASVTRIDRNRAEAAIDQAIEEVSGSEAGPAPPELRQRLAAFALTEIYGLGLIDRLWADRSVRAIFVDGPHAVHIERVDGRRLSSETFRDAAHLQRVSLRLARPQSTGVVEFSLRDGGSGVVIFAPASTDGPVLTIRRGEPGNATFDRLVATGLLDTRIAALLRVATRARFNIVVVGAEGTGKTALLAAVARDFREGRIVTLARHREFRWNASNKVELVVQPDVAYADLMFAGLRLQPDLLVLDSMERLEAAALADRLARGVRGVIASVRGESAVVLPAGSADLFLRMGRSVDGRCRVEAVEDRAGAAVFAHADGGFRMLTDAPAFVEKVRAAGYGQALAGIFR